ncbi:MMPL family transporter [Actinoallomurus sp. NPDC052308]|uniref:MMPL family transporter n=1 Tax=Actinoallomurus sp. NPDC052308 TaxID=3155530 RepID=UPI00342F25F5
MVKNSTRSLAAIPAGRRTKWLVLAGWLVVFFLLGSMAGKLTDAENNDATSFLPGKAESTQVFKLQKRYFSTNTSLAVIVYERPGGITSADRERARTDAAALATAKGVKGHAQGPLPSSDGQALQTLIPVDDLKVVDFDDAAHKLLKGAPPGLAVHVTGPAGVAGDQFRVFQNISGITALAAGIVVIVMLLLIYRSPFLWAVPLFVVGTALAATMGILYLLAEHAGLTVSAQTAGILPILVFGVGTDYAMLLIARYREELHRHRDKHEAMALALRRSGPAILASAATVACGMLCLMFAELNSTAGFGPSFAIGVGLALAAMTVLLPALLVILPRGVFWPRVPRFDAKYEDPDAYETEHGFWAGVARKVGARPRLIWAVTTLVLIALTLGLTSLRANGLSNEGQFVTKPDSVVGETVLARHFPAGTGAPAVVIGDAARSTELHDAIAHTPGVAPDQVASTGTAGGYVQYNAVLTDPSDSPAARRTIERLRTAVHQVGRAKVGGPTASLIDTRSAATHDNKLIMPIALAVVFVILILLLRAVVAPLLMMVTVALSFLASLGASAFLFDKAFGFQGEDTSFPLAAFVFLVALGVDYNIFLMTRVREESRIGGTRHGMLRGLTVTGGVITSAGLVLAATFAALLVLPIVGTAEIGFVVAFGVLLDTVIVRSLLLPALAIDLGRRIWWPSRLARSDAPAERADLPVSSA